MMRLFHANKTSVVDLDEDGLLRQITSENFNPLQEDCLGSDPWGLRVVTPLMSESFEVVIQRCTLNKSDIDFNKIITADPENKKQVPERIFIVWLGSAFDQGVDAFRSIVKAWRIKNPDHCINLVTDQLSLANYNELSVSNVHAREMIEWCSSNQVCITNYRDMVTSSVLLEHGLLHKNYGYASDILRLLLLKEYGGVYADIDIVAKKLHLIKLNKPFALGCSGVVMLKHTFELMSDEVRRVNEMLAKFSSQDNAYKAVALSTVPNKGHFSNDYLMAPVKNEATTAFIDLMLADILSRSSMPIEQLFNTYGLYSFPEHLYPYNLAQTCSLTNDIKHYYTVVTSGPNTLEKYRPDCDDVGVYESYYLASWLREYHSVNEETIVNKVKRIITSILSDLKFEPSILRLNAHLSSFSNPLIAGCVSRLLCDHFAQNIREVKYIVAAEYCNYEKPDNTEWLNTLMNVIQCAKRLQTVQVRSVIGITDRNGCLSVSDDQLTSTLSGMTRNKGNIPSLLAMISSEPPVVQDARVFNI